MKEVFLKNFGLDVRPSCRGLFDAACYAHDVQIEHDLEGGGGTILIITNKSNLEGFGERVRSLVEAINLNSNIDAFVKDVSTEE